MTCCQCQAPNVAQVTAGRVAKCANGSMAQNLETAQ